MSWTLAETGAPAAPTCATHRIAQVVVTATDKATGDAESVAAPCADGRVETPAMPLGSHTIELQAIGELDDLAGEGEAMGTLEADGEPVAIAQPIEVLAPETQMLALWSFARGGSTIDCAAAGSNGVRVTTKPEGGTPVTDIWGCADGAQPIDVAYGPFEVTATVLGANDVPIGTPLTQQVAPQRGEAAISFSFEIP